MKTLKEIMTKEKKMPYPEASFEKDDGDRFTEVTLRNS